MFGQTLAERYDTELALLFAAEIGEGCFLEGKHGMKKRIVNIQAKFER